VSEVSEVRTDPLGITHLGADGVARWLNANRTSVLKYKRLSPEQITDLASGFSQTTRDAFVGVDGRNVTDQAQLWALPNLGQASEEKRMAAEKRAETTPVKQEEESLFKRASCNEYGCETASECPKGNNGDPTCNDCITNSGPGDSTYCANI